MSIAVGSFDIDQLIQGRAALFNMWDYDMTRDELNAVGCRSEGNILKMSDMTIHGASYSQEELPCGTCKLQHCCLLIIRFARLENIYISEKFTLQPCCMISVFVVFCSFFS